MIVASCFHSGYFLTRFLNPITEAAKKDASYREDFDLATLSFCKTYEEALPQRTAFVKALSQIQDAETFTEACTAQLASLDSLNIWFDPIDPLSSITPKEICDLHFKLFTSLHSKERTSIAEFTSFSYLASLDLFINAHQ